MLFAYFSYNFNYALGWTVVHSLWQAMLIAVVTGILLLAFRKKTSAFKYRLLAFSMIFVLISSAITFWSYYQWDKGMTDIIEYSSPDLINTVNQSHIITDADQKSIDQTSENSELFSGVNSIKQYVNDHLYLIVLIWFIGLSISLLRLLGGISYVYYLKSRMNFPVDEYWQDMLEKLSSNIRLSKSIALVESALVRSPLVIGHLKPMILFPIGAINRLSEQEVEAILSHEIAHVLRNDYLINIFQNIVESLFYYHPAVWWISAQLRTERENCCDDVAITLCGNAVTYAKSLVSVQEMAFYSPALAMSFAGNQPKKQLLLRIQRLFTQPKSTLNVMEKVISSTTIFIFILFLSIAAKPMEPVPTCGPDESANIFDYSKKGNVLFLKYYTEGLLDSLFLDRTVNDGEYFYKDNIQEVLLAIKNNYVIRFNINGLEVAGMDISKFSKLIHAVLDRNQLVQMQESTMSKDQKLISSELPVSSLSKHKITLKDNNGIVTVFDYDDRGARDIFIFDKEEPTLISLNSKMEPQVDGKPADAEQLAVLGWKLTDHGLQPLEGFKNLANHTISGPEYAMSQKIRHDGDDAVKEKYEQLMEKTNVLLDQLAAYNHRDKDPGWFSWAESRLHCQPMLAKNNLNKHGLTSIEGELDIIERTFIKIKSQKGKSNYNGFNDYPDKEDSGTASDVSNTWSTIGDNNEKGSKGPKGSKGDKGLIGEKGLKNDDAFYVNPKYKKFDEWLSQQLVIDGYIGTNTSYHYEMKTELMKINGKKVDEKHLNSYQAAYERLTGDEWQKSTHKTGSFYKK
ncbi:MAG: M48 family metalloprotease [Saprospiraceae bacterium]|nr:M48 family metalloprotease [Saprospiraceae bacterium]